MLSNTRINLTRIFVQAVSLAIIKNSQDRQLRSEGIATWEPEVGPGDLLPGTSV